MRFELLPLLDAGLAARPRPLVVCSVRDLIQAKPERENEIARVLRVLSTTGCWCTAIRALARFERSFGPAARIAGKLHYTGYVVQDAPAEGGDAGADEVLVSAGGGAVGQRLLERRSPRAR